VANPIHARGQLLAMMEGVNLRLADAVQQRRARYRLRDLIILLLRAAAVVLLAIAFGRPLAGSKPLVADAPGQAVRVVILDRSQSMEAVSHGVQAFERARTEQVQASDADG
jgi:hypothetical protein